MKLLLDMNMSPRLADFLRQAGIDVVHWSQVGSPFESDQSIAAVAVSREAAVVTHDLDFGALLAATGGRRPSVIQIRADDLSVSEIGERLLDLCRTMAPELEAGVLVTLDLEKTRVRILPIRQ